MRQIFDQRQQLEEEDEEGPSLKDKINFDHIDPRQATKQVLK